MNQRRKFIIQLFEALASVEYTLLKFIENNVENIEEYSDLDLLVDRDTLPMITSIINNFESVEDLINCSSETMTQFFIYFQDGSFLQIDCLFLLIRKNLIYLSNRYVRENTKTIRGVKTYSNYCLFQHLLLFHQLNNDGLPFKYLNYFHQLPLDEVETMIHRFNQKYDCSINSLAGLQDHDPFLKTTIVTYLKSQSFNSISKRQINTFRYMKDTVKKLWNGRGPMITLVA